MIKKIVVSTGVKVAFQKNWPNVRDRYEEFLSTGEKNPDFVQRTEEPKFCFGHALVKHQQELTKRLHNNPADVCYQNGGRCWIMNGVRHTEDPRSRKIVEKDEEEDM